MAGAHRLRQAGTLQTPPGAGEIRLALPRRGSLLLGRRTLLMGIVNVTPDSFSDGGRYDQTDAAITHALRLEAEGADLLDIGGESTRPGADPVPLEEERRRVLPVVAALARRARVPLSIDTSKPELASEALAAGASILNDGAALAAVAAGAGAPLILMHSRGTPATMRNLTAYPRGVVQEIIEELAAALEQARSAGCGEDSLLIDPGIGFAKSPEQSLEILARLGELDVLGRPVVIGVSRKSFIGHVLDRPVDGRLEGTLVAEAVAVLGGARIVRTHDVAAARRAVDLADALRCAGRVPDEARRGAA